MMGVSLVASFAACIYPWINSFALMTIGVPTFVLLTKELKRFVWKFFFQWIMNLPFQQMSNSTSSTTRYPMLFLLDSGSCQLDPGSNVLWDMVRIQSTLSARSVAHSDCDSIIHSVRTICILWCQTRIWRSTAGDSILATWSFRSIRHSIHRTQKCCLERSKQSSIIKI